MSLAMDIRCMSIYLSSNTAHNLTVQYCRTYVVVLLFTGMVYWSVADPVITHPPQSAVRDVGGTVHFDCTIDETYQYYFEWKRDGDRLIYYTVNNTGLVRGPGFPAERFHHSGLYGLSIKSLTLLDGANYRCGFIVNNLFASANLFVIGEFSNCCCS